MDFLDGRETIGQHRFAHADNTRLWECNCAVETVLISPKEHSLRDFYGCDHERFIFSGIGDCNFNFHFCFWFGLVWRAVTGNGENLASGRSLSTSFL